MGFIIIFGIVVAATLGEPSAEASIDRVDPNRIHFYREDTPIHGRFGAIIDYTSNQDGHFAIARMDNDDVIAIPLDKIRPEGVENPHY